MFHNFLFLQAETTEATEAVMENVPILELMFSGGTIGVVIVIVEFVLLFFALYIFFERYFNIKQASAVDENFMNNIRANVSAGNLQAARALCQNTDTPVARMVEKGLARIGKPLRDIDAAIENVGNLEVFKLEKNLSTLASIAGAAPMIGFLGTVTGMILAFFTMEHADNVTPKALAGGINQALVTTAMGLVVGIFAFVTYNLLVAKVDKVIYQMERYTTDFMDLLQEPTA